MRILLKLERPLTHHLLPRLVLFGLVNQIALAALLFIPGTPEFPRGWALLILNVVVTVVFCAYFYRRDPEFLARRLLRREKFGAQKFIMFLLRVFSVFAWLLCSFDHRCGWTQMYLTPVPLWVSALALGGYAASYLLFIPVFNANRFAASVIRTEAGQTVADRGPYRLVRHPMYAVSLAVWLWIPPALGSLFGFAAVPLIGLVIIWRLLHEEKILRRELPGYTEYCGRTVYRLVPGVW